MLDLKQQQTDPKLVGGGKVALLNVNLQTHEIKERKKKKKEYGFLALISEVSPHLATSPRW